MGRLVNPGQYIRPQGMSESAFQTAVAAAERKRKFRNTIALIGAGGPVLAILWMMTSKLFGG